MEKADGTRIFSQQEKDEAPMSQVQGAPDGADCAARIPAGADLSFGGAVSMAVCDVRHGTFAVQTQRSDAGTEVGGAARGPGSGRGFARGFGFLTLVDRRGVTAIDFGGSGSETVEGLQLWELGT